MQSWGLVFLGVIALSSLVQGFFLLGLGWGGLKLMRRVEELYGRVEGELSPVLANVSRITESVSEVTEVASAQVQRVEALVDHTLGRAEETRAQVREAMTVPLGGLVEVSALLKGFRRALDVYKQLGALEAQGRGAGRRYRDDEHLFI
jgi:DNA-binding PucR family transcriptional regulator